MKNDERMKQFEAMFENVDPCQRDLVQPLLGEVIFLENKMAELKKLPFVHVHPKNKTLQKTTPAAKLYKECTQSYMNAIRILISVLKKAESSAAEELSKLLDEFDE